MRYASDQIISDMSTGGITVIKGILKDAPLAWAPGTAAIFPRESVYWEYATPVAVRIRLQGGSPSPCPVRTNTSALCVGKTREIVRDLRREHQAKINGRGKR